MISRIRSLGFLVAILYSVTGSHAAEPALRRFTEAPGEGRAVIRVQTDQKSAHPIPRFVTGKFAEHLGFNIYNGMDAQILRNPTFADYPFWNGQMSPDGVTKFQVDDAKIDDELRNQARRFGWPEPELAGLAEARAEALACFWTRVGKGKDVQFSPDTGPHGGRAQRVQVAAAGQGIAQWTWLPLHRQRQYEVEVMLRSPEITSVTVSLSGPGSAAPAVSAKLVGVSGQWAKLKGTLTVPPEWQEDLACKFTIAADAPGQLVLRHAFLRPADHIRGADPEIVALLKESHLPLLRWPGGNFVSTYHWEDAVGPVERRLTKPNLAWGGIEPNTFGTDEFIDFCRAVGCEPMICVNAGSGSAEEAARWIEYCNGPATSPMGRWRAENGHPEPFQVKYWEVGNELWGRWQMRWTTAQGYVDRFKDFAPAMLAADPSIRLFSCGAPAMWGRDWNRTLIRGVTTNVGTITDHPLIGGDVPPSTEPLDVYRDFMAVPEVLQQKWTVLRDDMLQAGLPDPKLAVTELQLFAHLGGASDKNAPVRLTRETLPGQGSMTEAIYDILVYHAAIRLSPFVEMITHSATVNHGGGLRKERERVWANPCHYAQSMFALFAESTPVAVEIGVALEPAPLVLPDLRKATDKVEISAIDALAALTPDQSLLLSIVHRGSSGPIDLEVQVSSFPDGASAEIITLSASASWEGNSREQRDRIKPVKNSGAIKEGKLRLTLAPYTVARVHVQR